MPHAAGATRSRVLLVKDHLFGHRQPAATGFLRPAEPRPSACCEFALPCLAQGRPGFFVAWTAAIPEAGELADEMNAHPGGHFGAQRLVPGCLICFVVHGVTPASTWADGDA